MSKNVVTLKSGSGHSRSLNESGPIRYIVYGFLLLFFSNIVPKTDHFWDIRLQKCRDLEIGVRGHSRSLKVVPFDRLCMVYYSLVTLSECTVFKIRLVSIQWPWNPG